MNEWVKPFHDVHFAVCLHTCPSFTPSPSGVRGEGRCQYNCSVVAGDSMCGPYYKELAAQRREELEKSKSSGPGLKREMLNRIAVALKGWLPSKDRRDPVGIAVAVECAMHNWELLRDENERLRRVYDAAVSLDLDLIRAALSNFMGLKAKKSQSVPMEEWVEEQDRIRDGMIEAGLDDGDND